MICLRGTSPLLRRASGSQMEKEECIHSLSSLFWRKKTFQNQPPLLLLLFCASSRILNLIRIAGVISFLYSLEQKFRGIENAANFLLSDVQ